MFNKTRAWEMEEGIKTDQATAVTAYDQYQGDSWKGIGMETASQMGSFALSPGDLRICGLGKHKGYI